MSLLLPAELSQAVIADLVPCFVGLISFPDLRLAVSVSELEYRASPIVRGLISLPVTWKTLGDEVGLIPSSS